MAVQLIIDKKPLVVKIPMKPYLVKFLTKKYGTYHKASKTSLLGLQALELLTDNYTKPQKNLSKSYFTLKIPFGICNTYGHFIDHNQVVVFQKKTDKLFKDLIVEHIKINSKNNQHGEVIKSIRNFFDYYGISEEDFSLDYAYKLVQRSNQKGQKKRSYLKNASKPL
jgi:hypothetical protein